jgi:hypothetical protein
MYMYGADLTDPYDATAKLRFIAYRKSDQSGRASPRQTFVAEVTEAASSAQ